MTPLRKVIDAFFTLITDDMYLEMNREELKKDCKGLLLASLPLFEFPNAPITFVEDFDIEGHDISYLEPDLTQEEINILAYGMVQIWLQRQVTSVEVLRQKFSGADFKITSQASHLQRLEKLLISTRDEHRRLQMLYSRRGIGPTGNYKSNFDMLISKTSR